MSRVIMLLLLMAATGLTAPQILRWLIELLRRVIQAASTILPPEFVTALDSILNAIASMLP